MRAKFKTTLAVTGVAGWILAAAPATADTIQVTNPNDSGPSSLRAAIEAANGNSDIDRILFRGGKMTVALQSAVVYSGSQALTIDGKGASVTADGAMNLLEADGGGDLHLKNIAFKNAGRSGVVVSVPGDSVKPVQSVSLDNVTLDGNGWYGLLFDDQSGGDGSGNDSPTGLSLLVEDSTITNNNNFDIEPVEADKDGIRLDEGGDGDIVATIVNSRFEGNAGDGIEFDEIGPGDVVVSTYGSRYDDNGPQPQFTEDLEDGLDVDEAGAGDIWVAVMGGSINGNQDEGLDLDEADEGSVYLNAVGLVSTENVGTNVKVTLLQNAAAEAGTAIARFSSVAVTDSLDSDGIKIENYDNDEEDGENLVGTLYVTIVGSEVSGNDSDDVQLEAASGTLTVVNSNVPDIKLEGGVVLAP